MRIVRSAVVFGLVALLLVAVIASQLPAIGAGGLLHPMRRRLAAPPPETCREATFRGADVTLEGWSCAASSRRRGTLIYLHGIADNRASGAGVIERFSQRGFDVVAYDSRGHGESGGDTCTYGFFEKDDLRRVMDDIAPGPVVLLGTSLGAAVALQHAARDRRVSAVIAAEPFADLRTIVQERAPFFFTSGVIERALALAERNGRFKIDDVNPAAAASLITSPVLLIHGAADTDTPADHARRVLAGLAGPKRLILVPGARHNESLRGAVWDEIELWLDEVLGAVTC